MSTCNAQYVLVLSYALLQSAFHFLFLSRSISRWGKTFKACCIYLKVHAIWLVLFKCLCKIESFMIWICFHDNLITWHMVIVLLQYRQEEPWWVHQKTQRNLLQKSWEGNCNVNWLSFSCLLQEFSLVPRPRPALHHLQYMGSGNEATRICR